MLRQAVPPTEDELLARAKAVQHRCMTSEAEGVILFACVEYAKDKISLCDLVCKQETKPTMEGFDLSLMHATTKTRVTRARLGK